MLWNCIRRTNELRGVENFMNETIQNESLGKWTHQVRKRVLLFISAWILTTGFCVAFVDRAASSWAHTNLKGCPLFAPLTHLVDPLRPGAALCLIFAGMAALWTRWRPGERGHTMLTACLAIIVSVALKDQLKFVFGRTWPETWVAQNPSWIADGVFGFHLFHGGEGWASFPSGHMTQIAACAAVLWRRIRPWRWLWTSLVALVAIGLFGANYHFVGDMVAGTFLGVATACGALALMGTPPETKKQVVDEPYNNYSSSSQP